MEYTDRLVSGQEVADILDQYKERIERTMLSALKCSSIFDLTPENTATYWAMVTGAYQVELLQCLTELNHQINVSRSQPHG